MLYNVNEQEMKFSRFLEKNHIEWDEKNKRSYEKYGDFYLQNDNIMVELKSLQETEMSKILTKLPSGYSGTVPFRDS